jgi:hypothetical protein
VAAEALLLTIASAAAYFMAVKLASRWTAVAISSIAVPMILTGEAYYPGYTALPGIVLVLVSITASAYGRPMLAGLCIGLLVFTKLIFAPVAVAGVGCFALMSRRFVEARAVALAASMSAVLVVGALVVRGEFLPFTETIKLNIAYSQGGLISTKGLASLAEHISRIGVYRLLAEVVPILLGIALVFVGLSGRHEPRSAQVAIAGACVSTLASSLAVLSITGLWDHHLQILYTPAIMTVVIVPGYGRQESKTHDIGAHYSARLFDGWHIRIARIHQKRPEFPRDLRRTW